MMPGDEVMQLVKSAQAGYRTNELIIVPPNGNGVQGDLRIAQQALPRFPQKGHLWPTFRRGNVRNPRIRVW